MAHANGYIPVNLAIQAGCDSIEHGFFMGRDNLNIMADKQIAWIPTAYTMKSYSEILKNKNPEYDICLRNYFDQLEQINYAKQIGVIVLPGSDAGTCGINHGQGLIQELKVLSELGYSVQNLIKMAAYNSARHSVFEENFIIKPDNIASFIAVKGKPEELIDNLLMNKIVYKLE